MSGISELIEKVSLCEEELKKTVIGQDKACSKVVPRIECAMLGLSNPNQPLGKFLFVGPTGVGKTELTKAMASYLYDDPRKFIAFDMSEYSQANGLDMLLGSENEEGTLVKHYHSVKGVEEKLEAVILFDELEKAHSSINDILLQVLDEGRVTSRNGQVLSFRNCFIICTSNAGSKEIANLPEEANDTLLEKTVLTSLEDKFRPEIIGRYHDVIVFNRLQSEVQKKIGRIHLENQLKRLSEQGYELTVSEESFSTLVSNSVNVRLGIRPLRDNIAKITEQALAKAIINRRIEKGSGKGELEISFVPENKDNPKSKKVLQGRLK